MTQMRLEIRTDDDLNPAQGVTLQDSTSTFGVRRKDTQEIIVASGTAMVQDAADPRIWRYTVADVAPGVTYEWVARIDHGDAIDFFETEDTPPDEAECNALLNVGQVDALLAIHVLSADLADWSALSAADKGVLICRAQAMIDAGTYKGQKWADDQPFSFPRRDDDGVLIGVENEADEDNPLAPLAVREALALLAHSFVHRADLWERHTGRRSGLASQSVSGISEAYIASGSVTQHRADLQLISDVWMRLGRFWRVAGRII